MSFSSAPQVESRIEFSPIPQDIEQGHDQNNDRTIEPCEEGFDCYAFVMVLRLALIGTLLVGLALRHRPLDHPNSDPIPPRIFLDSFHVPHFKVSDGELSSTWNLTLTISNGVNSSNINILRLDAAMTYKGNETLAVVTPIVPQYTLQSDVFPVEAEEKKGLVLKFSITGWEKDQPIVDDTVIQAIAEDIQEGVTRFGLKMRVVGEVEFGDGWNSGFVMYPSCNDLEIRLFAADQKMGEAATMVDGKPKECVGPVEWGPARDSL